MYLAYLESLLAQGDIENDAAFREMVRQAASDMGVKLATEVRDAFGIGNSIEDAVDAWKIGCVAAGVKYRVEKEGDSYVFHHPVCPMHEYFTQRGIVPCENLCLPTVEAIARTICPVCEVEVVHQGDLTSTCIKAIRLKKMGSEENSR